MNRIYRSIWNEKTATFVAVSENTKSAGKQSSTGANGVTGAYFALTALAISLMMAYGPPAHALPVGGVVAAGNAGIVSGAGSTTVTQSSQNAAINWQSFNIAAGEAVRFVQPNSSAVALNRVSGADPSSILGSLSANGRVFLVNPNGILFGQGAQVNVNALTASTLGITDSDFMAGRYKFAGAGNGKILNQGTINADGGYVALLGAHVSNEGTISARLGTVALAAGNAVTLDMAGDGLLAITVDQGAVQALVQNGGLIRADGGQVLLTAQAAGSFLQTAVNNTGVIQAQTIENRNGTIKLLGDMQSGTVSLGGKLDASAPNGGNGGFVETSAAHVRIADDARVTTAAARGLTGSWLIDPADYTIAATGGDITGAALSANLAGSNITILSSSGAAGTGGDVNVNDTVTWSANRLTLNAQRNININTAMNGSGTAGLTLEYGQGALAAGNTSKVNIKAPVNLPSGNNLSTKLGSNGTVVNYTVINDLGAAGSTTGTDLQGINGGLTGNYALGSNIDASATSGWNALAGFVPLGDFTTRFSGTFDGLGHTISNLTIKPVSTRMFVGLFGGINGTVRNVGLVALDVTGNYGVGGLSGYLNNGASISNSYVTGTVAGGNIVGGLVGRSHGSTSDSYATASVTATNTTGGLIGKNYGAISNSYATGAVSGNSYGGGLAGINLGNISNSYATGSVTGTAGSRHWSGGLVGINYNTVTTSYATGAVIGGSGGTFGGLVGKNYGNTTKSFWDTTTSGQATSNGGLGMTTAQMKTQANFTSATAANGNVNPAWDFANTWVMYDTYTYPLLRTFMTALTVTAGSAAKTYDAAAYNGANSVTYSTATNGNLLGAVSYVDNTQGAVNAGSYSVTPGGLYSTSQQGGYAINFVAGALTVNRAGLTVSTGDVSKVYDGGLTAAGSATVTGGTLFGTDTISGGTFAFTDQNAGSGKTVTAAGVTVNGVNSGGNYNVSYANNNTSTITPKALTVTGETAADKMFDGTTVATLTGGMLSGVIAGDAVTLTEAGTFATANPGTAIAVTASNRLGGAAAGNYRITQPTGLTANITGAAPVAAPVVAVTPAVTVGQQNAIANAVSTTATFSPKDTVSVSPSSSSQPPRGLPVDGSMRSTLAGLNVSVIGEGINLPPGVQPGKETAGTD